MRCTHEAPGGRLGLCRRPGDPGLRGPRRGGRGAAVPAAVGQHDHADQALHLPDAGRPDLRQLLRQLPRGGRSAPGTCQPRAAGRPRAQAASSRSRWIGKELPPLGASRAVIANQYNGGKMNGFVSAYQRQARNGSTVHGLLRPPSSCPSTGTRRAATCCSTTSSRPPRTASGPIASYWVSAATAPGGRGGVPDKGYGKQPHDLRPAAGRGRELEVLRAGIQPSPDLPHRLPGQPGDPDPPGFRWSITRASPRTPPWPATSSTWTSTPRTWRPARCPRSATSPARPRITSARRGRSWPGRTWSGIWSPS